MHQLNFIKIIKKNTTKEPGKRCQSLSKEDKKGATWS